MEHVWKNEFNTGFLSGTRGLAFQKLCCFQSFCSLTRQQRQEKAESLIILAKTLDDLSCITDNDLFGAVSTCDPLTAQLIGGQGRDFVREWRQNL